jgi:hypothetical protein
LFGDRNPLGIAVDGGRGRKHDPANAMLHERPHEGDSMTDVVLKIFGGILDGFSDFDQSGKVNAGFQFMFARYARDQFPVADFPAIHRNIGVQRGAMASLEVVQNHNVLTLGSQAFDGYAADIARASGYQD